MKPKRITINNYTKLNDIEIIERIFDALHNVEASKGIVHYSDNIEVLIEKIGYTRLVIYYRKEGKK